MTTQIPLSCPSRTSILLSNLASVTVRVTTAATAASNPSNPSSPTTPRLVAVSKLKPASDILTLHQPPASHIHFGENYQQELTEKSRLLPPTIKWHFIGGLQSNKCVALAREVRGLWAVESVDSEKKASLLDRGWGERSEEVRATNHEERLRVFVQVNTSGEENKSGVEPKKATELCAFIREKCPRLRLQGVMTIGAIARSRATTAENENEDFACLKETRDRVVADLALVGEEAGLELSMGMSEDFEGAIALGSDQVRVGTTIFGERPPKDQAKVV
ncbi:alanine racemase family protein [Aspergillus heteromorphus CBS 117.55]|uniref:Pyridoxal phosphate homeostasis protein n=1 Tax=Aspergillus heteromorphus CBS 117.55 TaxID=1448321 RepID=A0A317UW81_9EURO|nr:alanine racemase family protein [Aspergillus heteromorphus CBS 117.55]PWY64767.1 alanine racemase family protein [Aspergillus heteromorphus CBS 117.55]